MKKYFAVSFKYSDSVYCSNIAHAETAADVESHYSKYEWISVRECSSYEVETARRKGMPIVEVEPAEPAESARLHISDRNSKLGCIPNMSLTPGKTCSASACSTCLHDGCYACKSYRLYPSVRSAWDDNTTLALCGLERMERELDSYFSAVTAPRFFRIHVGGDFVTTAYAMMWYRIAERHPGTNFLAFTKQFDVVRNVPFYLLKNFSLRLSDWPGVAIPDDLRAIYPVAWMDDGTRPESAFPADALECPGHCDTCGACWGLKDRDTIFHKH